MTGSPRPSARCRSLLLELSRYLDDDLTPARRRTIERHIEGCRCCGTMAGRLQETLAACRAAVEKRLPPAVKARAVARIRALLRNGIRPAAARRRQQRRRKGGDHAI